MRIITVLLSTYLILMGLVSPAKGQAVAEGKINEEVYRLENRDANVDERRAAAKRLGEVAKDNKNAVRALKKILLNKSEDIKVQTDAAEALSKVAPNDTTVSETILEFADNTRERATGKGEDTEKIKSKPDTSKPVPKPIVVPTKSNTKTTRDVIRPTNTSGGNNGTPTTAPPSAEEPAETQTDFAKALASIKGIQSLLNTDTYVRKEVYEQLVKMLEDYQDTLVHDILPPLFLAEAEKTLRQAKAGDNKLGKLDDTIKDIQYATNALSKTPDFKPYVQRMTAIGTELEQINRNQNYSNFIKKVTGDKAFQATVSFAAYALIAFIISYLLLYTNPLWLLSINDCMKRTDLPVPDQLAFLKPWLRFTFVFGFFHYHPKVLDAWVKKHIKTARTRFQQEPTVEDRNAYVELPVEYKGLVRRIKPADLQNCFESNSARLLIWGEGGTGKTALMCQIAQWGMSEQETERICMGHLMLPILIEENIEGTGDANTRVIEAVRGVLKDLIDAPNAPPVELVKQLLKQRRLLVIMDSFSELTEATRSLVRVTDPDFPVNALLITSRREEALNGAMKTTLKTGLLNRTMVTAFIERYLERKGKNTLFPDSEFHNGLASFANIVGDNEVTVQLARLYADYMIATKEPSRHGKPQNIPELFDFFVNQINARVSPNAWSNRIVHIVARRLSWACVERKFHATEIRYDDALAALKEPPTQTALQADAKTPEMAMDYLLNTIRIFARAGSDESRIRSTHDPVTESLAARYLVEEERPTQTEWDEIFAKAEKSPNSVGFLRAIREVQALQSAASAESLTVAERLQQLTVCDDRTVFCEWIPTSTQRITAEAPR